MMRAEQVEPHQQYLSSLIVWASHIHHLPVKHKAQVITDRQFKTSNHSLTKMTAHKTINFIFLDCKEHHFLCGLICTL